MLAAQSAGFQYHYCEVGLVGRVGRVGIVGRVGYSTSPTPPTSPTSPIEHLRQFLFGHSVFRRFLSVYQQHRNFESVLLEERSIVGDVNLVDCDGGAVRTCGKDAMDRGLHLVAQMAARLAEDRQAHDLAMSSAAQRGSAAATIGRPTTR